MVGCATSPAQWAVQLPDRLRCGMTPKEVEAVSERRVVALDPPRTYVTHLIRDEATDVWLVFREERLRSVQLAWMRQLKRVDEEPVRQLCASD